MKNKQKQLTKDKGQKQVDASEFLESLHKHLPSIKDFISKEKTISYIIDEMERIEEEIEEDWEK